MKPLCTEEAKIHPIKLAIEVFTKDMKHTFRAGVKAFSSPDEDLKELVGGRITLLFIE